MPRIRKKTSNRQSTAQRAKITRKAGETRKKNKKAARKNPQWKSKKKADPGIPNSFPYKDQILAEVAEERRQEEAAKIARKEAARSKPEEKEEDTPGIASLHTSSVYTATREPQAGSSTEQAEDEAPALVDTSLATLQDVLDRADVVLQVVDARDIAGGRNTWIEELLKDTGVYGLVVSKADLVPREALEAWLPSLPANTFFFSAPETPTATASTSSSKPSVLGRTELLAKLKDLATSDSARDGDLRVALMGLPSVGKTSILNALLPSSGPKHSVAPHIPPVSSAKAPGPTTKAPVEVSLDLGDGITVKVIDTPGWDLVPEDIDEEDVDMVESGIGQEKWDALEEVAVGDVLRRNLGRVDRIKEVLPLADYIVQRANAQDLMLMYNVPFFASGDAEAFLRALARANGRLKKGDQPDIEAGARILLRDWALNQFPYYSMPTDQPQTNSLSGTSRPDMSTVLKACKSKKEMRASGRGLVRFRPGTADQREVILDDDYTAAFEPSEDDEDEQDLIDDDMEDDDTGDDPFERDDAALEGLAEEEDDDGDIQIGSDEEEEEIPIRRKGGGATKVAPKKVSFGALPEKESKREIAKLVGKGSKGKKGGARRSR